jgi:hypothetical protein
METVISILLGFCLTGLLGCLYALIRNQCVYNYRMNKIKESVDNGDWTSYNNLPSYETMFNKFWVWPLNRFEVKK